MNAIGMAEVAGEGPRLDAPVSRPRHRSSLLARVSRKVCAGILLTAAIVGPLLFGSNVDSSGGLLAIFAGLAIVVAAFIPVEAAGTRRLITVTLGCSAGLVVLAFVQNTSGPWPFVPNGIWTEAARLLGEVKPTISVSRDQPLYSIGYAVTPLALFAASLAAFNDEEEVLRFWRLLILVGCGIAFLLLVQFHVTPKTQLWDVKEFYLGDFTLSYINRNTAATHLGCTLVIVSALLFRSLRRTSYAAMLLGGRKSRSAEKDAERDVIVLALIAGVLLVGVLLTRSRAGIGASVLGMIVFWSIALWPSLPTGRARMAAVGALGAGAAGILWLFGGLVLFRVEVQGLYDASRACAFEGAFQVFKDNPVFGTGLGTFQDIYPVYRDPACGLYAFWDKAHNTYLEGLQSIGVVGIAIIAILVVATLSTIRYGLATRVRYRFIIAACLGLFVVASVHATVDFSLQIPGFSAYLAILLGSGVSVAFLGGRNA